MIRTIALVTVPMAFLMVAPFSASSQQRGGHYERSAARDRAGRTAVTDADIVTFRNAPYPFEGQVPEQNKPFLEQGADGRQFHDSPRGGRLYADITYSDSRSLVFVPPTFDPAKPGAAIVLFFHGNQATLRDVIDRQGVPRQLRASRMNAVLVAPQLAVDALDSSPGHFYDPGFFQRYLAEAQVHLAERSGHRFRAQDLADLPVIIVAYSGGYLATAFTLHYADDTSRVRGIVLLDALFGEDRKIQGWIERTHASTFFVNASSKASEPLAASLRQSLQSEGIVVQSAIPKTVGSGDIVFVSTPDVVHNDYVTNAWTKDPLTDVLKRIRFGPRS